MSWVQIMVVSYVLDQINWITNYTHVQPVTWRALQMLISSLSASEGADGTGKVQSAGLQGGSTSFVRSLLFHPYRPSS